jgi:multicomponent Na+:H+ antiporter subunit B
MGVPNMVAAVLASYRSIDTLGEAFVILTAGLAVYALLSARPRRRKRRRAIRTSSIRIHKEQSS